MTEQHEDHDTNQSETHHHSDPDYNTMIGHEDFGSAQGAGVPEQTARSVRGGNVRSGAILDDIEAEGSSTGGRNTTNSTVSGGGTAGGTNIGLGATRDRGTMSNAPALSQNSEPIMGMPPLRADVEAHNPVPLQHTKGGQVEKNGQIVPERNPLQEDPSPLSPQEAETINRDARNSSNVPLSEWPGNDQ